MSTAAAEKVDQLRERQASLKVKELRLRKEFMDSPDKDARDELAGQIRETKKEILVLGSAILEAKEVAKQKALDALLASPAYRKAVQAAAEGLGAILAPWLDLVTLTETARRKGAAVPALPPFLGTAYVEGVAWMQAAIRRGSLDPKTLPPALRSLVEG